MAVIRLDVATKYQLVENESITDHLTYQIIYLQFIWGVFSIISKKIWRCGRLESDLIAFTLPTSFIYRSIYHEMIDEMH
jgi:hypothetical protein